MARPLALMIAALALVAPACEDVQPDGFPEPGQQTKCQVFFNCFSGCDHLLYEAADCVGAECPSADEVEASVKSCDDTCMEITPSVTAAERESVHDHITCMTSAVTLEDDQACDAILKPSCVQQGEEVIQNCVRFSFCFARCDNLLLESAECPSSSVPECPTDAEVDAAVAMCEQECAPLYPTVTESERDAAIAERKCSAFATTSEEMDACEELLPAQCVEP